MGCQNSGLGDHEDVEEQEDEKTQDQKWEQEVDRKTKWEPQIARSKLLPKQEQIRTEQNVAAGCINLQGLIIVFLRHFSHIILSITKALHSLENRTIIPPPHNQTCITIFAVVLHQFHFPSQMLKLPQHCFIDVISMFKHGSLLYSTSNPSVFLFIASYLLSLVLKCETCPAFLLLQPLGEAVSMNQDSSSGTGLIWR